MSDSVRSTTGTARFESEEEFIEWLEDFRKFATVGTDRGDPQRYETLQKAMKVGKILGELERDELSFEEAVEKYERELVTDT